MLEESVEKRNIRNLVWCGYRKTLQQWITEMNIIALTLTVVWTIVHNSTKDYTVHSSSAGY